ncbi:NAD(P)-dependent alcohol dehydrogenase [Thalassospira mesophila]|uniref:Hydroxyacid dehydrogenase n=1 Tax=Thalassospira mesophila TaxID=1293891 RepID=A0A1Y2L0U9_9PROT|nr:NAD(P)-dependent alcohol dehydrogenase [Thalassospira mesophila]OSQ38850.1 hydroxyacid dehydrogenase [Thalassospira mesophila]
MQVAAYGAKSATSDIEPLTIERRQTGAHDIAIDIDFCGVCHSDLHMARNDWGVAMYPVVPGHEIVGRVTDVGAHVKGFKPGDLVGVGCMVDSCQSCPSCDEGLEQYCENGMVGTYNGDDKVLGGHTYGGYSGKVVVNEKFVLRVSDKLETKAVAPLLCAGITTWSPLRHWNVKKGDKVGVVGLGGLGHMGVKFAAALGAHVVMITTSAAKGEDAKRLGAHEVLVSKDADAMAAHTGSFDFLLNTIPVKHDLNPYIALLKRDATMVIVGAVEPLEGFHGAGLIMGRKRIAGSLIGGIAETQEMLDFCAEHGITSDVEMINIDTINNAYERMQKSDVKYRFVIDMKSLKAAA